MPLNKLALIRYKTIDDCLTNRRRKWTLEDLMEKVGSALYEAEGIHRGVSRRTIQADLQLMRSDKLGYNAPIVIREKKYYTYQEPDYSITRVPINSADVLKMREIVGLLKQFSGFSYFDEMSDMIARLENNLQRSINQGRNCIQMEGNQQLKGINYIMPLYQAILRERSLLVEYQSFRAQRPSAIICYPYLLKEHRNRWFVLVRPKKGTALLTLALDRILDMQELPQEPFMAYEGVDFERYFSETIGVTRNVTDRARRVILRFDKDQAPYVLTKPLHPSQTMLKEDDSGVILRIDVVFNFELEREILGFGEHVRVLSPRHLSARIQARLEKSAALYRDSAIQGTA